MSFGKCFLWWHSSTAEILFRACIWPLIKFPNDNIIPGAHWEKADGKDDVFRKWQSAVDEDAVDCIGGVYVAHA